MTRLELLETIDSYLFEKDKVDKTVFDILSKTREYISGETSFIKRRVSKVAVEEGGKVRTFNIHAVFDGKNFEGQQHSRIVIKTDERMTAAKLNDMQKELDDQIANEYHVPLGTISCMILSFQELED